MTAGNLRDNLCLYQSPGCYSCPPVVSRSSSLDPAIVRRCANFFPLKRSGCGRIFRLTCPIPYASIAASKNFTGTLRLGHVPSPIERPRARSMSERSFKGRRVEFDLSAVDGCAQGALPDLLRRPRIAFPDASLEVYITY